MNYFLTDSDAVMVKSKLLSQFPELIQGTSTRKGGVSEGIHATMNLGFNNGDLPDRVRANYDIICKELDIPAERIVLAKQTHTSNIRIVTEEDLGKGLTRPVDYEDIDALITNKPFNGGSAVLTILTADCVPVSVYDPKHMAIGLAHSGWRGTVAQITAKMLKKMEEVYETDPADVYLSTGPCICKNCYVVSEDVAREFRKVYNEIELENILFPLGSDDKYRVDLAVAIKTTAMNCGVLESRLEMQDICTSCNSELLFSHRITMGKRGTLATFLGIR